MLTIRCSAAARCSRRWPRSSPLAGARQAQDDPLPSWNDGAAKQAILDFVDGDHHGGRRRPSCRPASASPPSTRTARCGSSTRCTARACSPWTGWPRWRRDHPEWKEIEPFKTVLTGDREAIAKLTETDSMKILAATHAGMSTRRLRDARSPKWLPKPKNPVWKRPDHRADLPADAGGSRTTCAPTATRPTSSPAAARISSASIPRPSTASRRSRWSASIADQVRL